MYWPVGAPRVYAAAHEKSARSAGSANESTSKAGLTDDRNEEHDVEQEGRGGINSAKEDDSQTPRILSREQLQARERSLPDGESEVTQPQEYGDNIIGLQVARNGQIFATITSTDLTVWQTRVSITFSTNLFIS